MRYRAEIDGLRAIAVIPVILFHADFALFRGGYIGVDVFFVISGYLITTIIADDLAAGQFRIINFYERRARRILPALFLVLSVSTLFALFLFLPHDMKYYSESLVSVVVFASNIFFWKTSNYFDTASELKPLLHTWSLAVEEQFYVFFPALLIILFRVWQDKVPRILSTLFLVAAISFGAAVWGAENAPAANFFLLPTRGWELLMGSFLSFLHSNGRNIIHNNRASEIAAILGIMSIFFSIFVFDNNTPYPSAYTLIPVFGTALIILNDKSTHAVNRVLGSRPFVGIGLISYSAYLWHQPIFAFARYVRFGRLDDFDMIILSLSVIVLAFLSWRFVERPFRSKERLGADKVFAFSALGSLIFAGLGLAGYYSNGLEWRLSTKQREILDYIHYPHKDIYREGVCFLEPEQTYRDYSKICSAAPKNALMIWGDSHAAALSYGLRTESATVSQYTASGCPPIVDTAINSRPHCKEINDFIKNKIKEIAPTLIILHANWKLYKEQNLTERIRKTIEYIRRVSPASQIVIVGPVPQWEPSLPAYMALLGVTLDKGRFIPSLQLEELKAIDASLRKVADSAGVRYFSALEVFCKGKNCLATISHDGQIVLTAWDYGHLTAGGSAKLAESIGIPR